MLMRILLLSDLGTTPPIMITSPAPSVTSGTASASDGTSASYVTLSLSGESANIGDGRYYYCTLSATGASSQDTNHDRGYIGVGSLTYQWQMSDAYSDSNYNTNLGTTNPYNATATPNGVIRFFRCVVSAAGANNQNSSADVGYRLTSPLYWVGGGGDLADATNHLSVASGGSPGAGNTLSDMVSLDI